MKKTKLYYRPHTVSATNERRLNHLVAMTVELKRCRYSGRNPYYFQQQILKTAELIKRNQ